MSLDDDELFYINEVPSHVEVVDWGSLHEWEVPLGHHPTQVEFQDHLQVVNSNRL